MTRPGRALLTSARVPGWTAPAMEWATSTMVVPVPP